MCAATLLQLLNMVMHRCEESVRLLSYIENRTSGTDIDPGGLDVGHVSCHVYGNNYSRTMSADAAK